ncbi:MAG: pyrroline-5-carboxylate reductase [Coriobacteriales bacterium]|nr:pyrroline-5-carboxylate reductase [Actinomycetes bacterium]
MTAGFSMRVCEAAMKFGRVAVIGGGRMGEAIVAGLLAAEVVEPGGIVIAEPDAARREVLTAYGVRAVLDGHEAVVSADVVIFAVKPQVIDLAVAHLADEIPAGAVVVSIAAGITTARLESLLRPGTAVVRVMPNTPAMVGQGMSVVSGGSEATSEQVEAVREMFDALGRAITLDERYQDAAGAISGSGPAYVALIIDALARAGVRQGLSRDVAQTLALQTMRGTVELIERTGSHPEALVDGVSSPGGTTIAAIEALEAGGLRSAMFDAVAAAVRRSKELGS